MMLYEDKVKENGQLKDKLDQIQQIQTAMLAYVLSQNYYLGAAFGGIPSNASPAVSASSFSNISKKDTGSPILGSLPSGGF